MTFSQTPLPTSHSSWAPVRLAVLVTIGIALLLAGPTPSAVAAGEGGEHPPPPLTVTVTKSGDPRYGDDLVLQVASDGLDGGGTASITRNGIELIGGVLNGKTTFRLPTLGRFKAETTYTLRVLVGAEGSSGESTIKFTPTKIAPTLYQATPRVTFGSEMRLALLHDGPTVLSPTGKVHVKVDSNTYGYPILASGNVYADHPYLTNYIGVHPVAVSYYGDENFAPFEWTGQVTIDKLPTVTPATLTASIIEPGDAISVKASPVSADGTSSRQPQGSVQAYVAPAESTAWVAVGSPVAFNVGGTAVVDLTEAFAGRAPGAWQVKAQFQDAAFYASSETVLPLTVVADDPVKSATQTTVTVDRSPVVAGTGPVTVTATVTATDHTIAAGTVDFTIGGTTVQAPLDATGRAQVTRSLPVGPVTIGATYGGSATKLESSGSLGLDVAKATTSVAVTPPAGAVAPGAAVPVQITATNAPIVPTGTFDVLEGGVRIAGGTVAEGRFLLPALARGRHALTVAYGGDELADVSRADLVVEVSGTSDPGTDPGTRPADDLGAGPAGPAGPSGPSGPSGPASTRAGSTTVAKVVKVRPHRVVVLRVRVASSRVVTGAVQIMERGKVVGRTRLKAGSKGRATVRLSSLRPGKHRLQVRYAGSASVTASTSKRLAVRIR